MWTPSHDYLMWCIMSKWNHSHEIVRTWSLMGVIVDPLIAFTIDYRSWTLGVCFLSFTWPNPLFAKYRYMGCLWFGVEICTPWCPCLYYAIRALWIHGLFLSFVSRIVLVPFSYRYSLLVYHMIERKTSMETYKSFPESKSLITISAFLKPIFPSGLL